MNTVKVTFRRTLSSLRGSWSLIFATALFLAATFFFTISGLVDAVGSRLSFIGIWAMSVAKFLPVYIAFLAMDTFSEERRSGRLDLLLSIAVRERELVIGKVLGVWLFQALTILGSYISAILFVKYFCPDFAISSGFAGTFSALFILFLQGALWSVVAVAVSALFIRPAAVVSAALLIMVALPRVLELPLEEQVLDFSAGVFSCGTILIYLVLGALFGFIASKSLLLTRFAGRASRGARFAVGLAITLAILVAASISKLALAFDWVLDVPVSGQVCSSPRLRHVLSESSGRLTVTLFLSRKDAAFRPTSIALRSLRSHAQAAGGAEVTLKYVDPAWDVGPAERLIRLGATERSIVFEKGHRSVALPLADGLDDRLIASSIRKIAMPPQRRDVYWTVGHGESAFTVYDAWGMSDIARELARDGYRNFTLDLADTKAIPADCAMLIVAGAKDGFSRTEIGRLDGYLKGGGRMLVLMGPPGDDGVASLLPQWGIRTSVQTLADARTISGSDVIVSDFADHAITSGFSGSRIVLENPLTFAGSAVAEGAVGADRIEFTPLARIGSTAVVAAAERGVGIGGDVALRPTRIVVIGDPTFVMNGQLAERANANRDFFLNVIAYLSGSDVISGDKVEASMIPALDRTVKTNLIIYGAVVFPVVLLLLMSMPIWRRRRKL